MIEQIKDEVKKLLGKENKGHGFDHANRVYKIAIDFAEKENADKEIVAISALLHDCDDYKMLGQEVADNLTNSKNIMNKCGVTKEKQEIILDIIDNMGYSKSIKGIRPKTLEGQIVSDVDMLEGLGISGTIRTLVYTVLKKGEDKIFNPEIFPVKNLTFEDYKKPDRKEDSFINHHFDKILKLKHLILTKSIKKEAIKRHNSVVFFLKEFFREQCAFDWIKYLEEYEKNN